MNSRELLLELKRKLESGGGGICCHIGSMRDGEISVKALSVNGEVIINFKELINMSKLKDYFPGIKF
jgi:hypothetical protein